MSYYGSFMNANNNIYNYDPVSSSFFMRCTFSMKRKYLFLGLGNSSGIGMPIAFGSGLPFAIPTSRTTVVRYGPSFVIDPAVSFPGVIAANPAWDFGEVANYNYGL